MRILIILSVFALASCEKEFECQTCIHTIMDNGSNATEYCVNGVMGDYPDLELIYTENLGEFCSQEEIDSLKVFYERTTEGFVCNGTIPTTMIRALNCEKSE